MGAGGRGRREGKREEGKREEGGGKGRGVSEDLLEPSLVNHFS